MKQAAKTLLTRIGRGMSRDAVQKVNAAVNYLDLGRWMGIHGHDASCRVESRERLYDIVGAEVGKRDVLYMEFGVWKGEATRYWSKLLQNPASKLHGFDSFVGLPESWKPDLGGGHFSVNGAIPQIDDPRVQFFKGWFQDTLPQYKVPGHDVLVLNLDADLYSSTIFVLKTLRDHIGIGSFLCFDEFNDRQNELRAFDEFIAETNKEFRLLGVTRGFAQAMFQCVR